MWQEIRHGLRRLARSPGFTVVAVVTVALGMGATTAMFSIVHAVLLAPLPYPAPQQLVLLHARTPQFSHSSVSYPNYLDWQRRNHSFSSLAAYRGDDSVLAGEGTAQPEHLRTETVSANFFSTLGVHLLAGPGLSPSADRPNGAPQAVLSYGLWQQRFGGDPHLVGKAIPLNGKSYEVVGILPRDFWFWNPAQIYTPLGQYLALQLMNRQVQPGIVVVGRLKPGVTLTMAQADMSAIGRDLAREYPKADAGQGVAVDRTRQRLVSGASATLWMLLGAVGLVLLIACANVANLMLARASHRGRELAIRAALGAGSGRLTRQVLTESVLLGLAGGAVGLALAWAAVSAAPSLIPAGLPRLDQIRLDAPVLAFTLVAAIASGILFGLIPAWRARRPDLQVALREGGRSAAGSNRTQQALVMAEVALSLMLLAGAGLLVQSLIRLQRIQPGFDYHHVLTMQVALGPEALTSGARVVEAHRQLLARVRRLPGVQAAAETSLVPLEGSDSEMSFWQGGAAQPPPEQMHSALSFIVSPQYLKAMGIPLLRGRFFNDGDHLGRPTVIVIDSEFAQHIFPHQNPIGQKLQLAELGPVEVVGVAGHVKFWSLGGDSSARIQDQFYFPIDQVPLQYMTLAGQGAYLLVRTAGQPLDALAMVRRAVAGPGRDQPVYHVETMAQYLSLSLASQKFLMGLLGMFAALALLLAAIGIYGVLAYAVAQRTREIGIRMALGAAQASVLRQVVGEGVRVALLGAAIGVVGALATTRFLRADLYGVAANDPLTLAVVTALLLAVAALASYLPARRASQVDPIVALRED